MYELRLANVMGLDIKNAQHSVAIDEALFGIEDPEAFLEFCRQQKEGIEYQTKTERLDTLATRYRKNIEDAKIPHDTANKFSDNLAEKVHIAKSFIKNQIELGNPRPFSTLRVDGKPYFTQKELTALTKLGSISYLMHLADTSELKQKLRDLFIARHTKRAQIARYDKNEKATKQIANIAKRF